MLIVWIVAILVLVLTSGARLNLLLSDALLLNGLVCRWAAPCSRLLLRNIPGSLLLLSERILDRELIKVDDTWLLSRLLESIAKLLQAEVPWMRVICRAAQVSARAVIVVGLRVLDSIELFSSVR